MTKHISKIKGFQYRGADDASDQKMLDDVKHHGWHIVAIPEDDVGPGFAFTVGLYLHTLQPEILIMGRSGRTRGEGPQWHRRISNGGWSA